MSTLDALDTPALVVDLDVFDDNLERMRRLLSGGARMRPHLKTAKAPAVARRLLAAGAIGVCVAKLGEAEVMVAAGIERVLITSELAGAHKAARLAALVASRPGARIQSVVDDLDAATTVAAALRDAGVDAPHEILVDVDIGQGRTGVPPEQAAPLADALLALPELEVVGVQGYQGHLQHVRDPAERARLDGEALGGLVRAAEQLEAAGHRVRVVTTGGTGTAATSAHVPRVTDVQPGSFVFMDTDYLDTGGLDFASSLTVLSTVVSRNGDRITVDAGLKAMTDDSGQARLAAEPAGWRYRHAGDEHGILSPQPGAAPTDLRPGDRVALIPSHVDPTINLHDVMYAHRGGVVEETWEISARGRIQ